MYLLQLLGLLAIQIWLVTATRVLYVLSDDSTKVSCPSQPCATLSQYLLDNNGTLPVVSNVEYHFLPGEHHLPASLVLYSLYRLTLTGTTSNGSLLAFLVGCSYQTKYLLFITNSTEVKIVNLVFKQCKIPINPTFSFLVIVSCISSKVENVVFLECGIQAYNLCGISSIYNVSFELHQALPNSMFHHAIGLTYV